MQLGWSLSYSDHYEHSVVSQSVDICFRIETTESTPLIHCVRLSTWGSCPMVTSLHVITTGLPNQLSILSMAIPISSAKMPTTNVAKKVISLRACNLLGCTFVHHIITPFVTSSLQRACSKISFPMIDMHTVNVVFASVGTALWFILAIDIFKCIQLLLRRTGIICMPLTITDRYYCLIIKIIIKLWEFNKYANFHINQYCSQSYLQSSGLYAMLLCYQYSVNVQDWLSKTVVYHDHCRGN